MKKLTLFMLSANLVLAQTSTGTYGEGCGGSCAWSFFQSARGANHTDRVFIYITGGGWSQMSVLCPSSSNTTNNPTMCAQFTNMTLHNYQVYAIKYSTYSQGLWPAQGQDVACFISYAIANNLNGNWNDILIAGDSAGAQVAGIPFAANQGKYLTSNSHCQSSNTNFTFQGFIDNSGPPDMTNNTNGYNTFPSSSGPALMADLFGGNPASGGTPATLATDATVTNYLGQWASRGGPRWVHVHGGSDSTVPPANSSLLPAAIVAQGYSNNYQEIFPTGYGHTLDNATGYNSPTITDAWPWSRANLSNTTYQSFPYCGGAENTGPNVVWQGTMTANTTNGSPTLTNLTYVSGQPLTALGLTIGMAGTGLINPTVSGTNYSGTGNLTMWGVGAGVTGSNYRNSQNATATGTGVTITYSGQNTVCGLLGIVNAAWESFFPARSSQAGSGSGMAGTGSW